MIVYRICKGKYKADLSGKGAELYSGRWNSKGIAMLYTSQSRALAFTEVAAHLPLGILPTDYFMVSIFVPDQASARSLAISSLSEDWRSFPHANSTQQIGDQFIQEGRHLLLKVPSAIVPGDFNLLLNPNHEQMNEVRIKSMEPFEFDGRFFSTRQVKGQP